MTNKNLRECLGASQTWCASQLGISHKAIRWKEQKECPAFRDFLLSLYQRLCKGDKTLPSSILVRELVRRELTEWYLNQELDK
jgi:DNA-binding XRE family transcriptional regulator